MMIEEIQGDLFELAPPTASLAHCVSRCFTMGKGIAVEFKRRFGRVDLLKSQKRQVRQVAGFELERGRFIYYLITKELYWHKPTIFTLMEALEDMRNHAMAKGVKEIACPRLGCGLDGLDWDLVKRAIEAVFCKSDIKIYVYYL